MKIDFIITWVNQDDSNWNLEKSKYESGNNDDNENRYRDYGLLNEWFERVWQYAPWVNNVFLVTANQAPTWAIADSRITVINHDDFIPKQYLPTFNSTAIELNLWRINELSEHFVYFNDDMFLSNDVIPEDFFSKDGLPVLTGAQNAISPMDDLSKIVFNNMVLVNQEFSKSKVIKKHLNLFLSSKYGLNLMFRSLISLPYKLWTGFYEDHLPYPLVKSGFELIANKYSNEFDETYKSRFRGPTNLSIWVIKNMQIASGNFLPRNHKFGSIVNVKKYEDLIAVEKLMKSRKIVVVNDDVANDSFDSVMGGLKKIMTR